MANLSSYTSVATNLLIKIEVAEYRASAAASYVAEEFYFTDSPSDVVFESNTYTSVGDFMSITQTSSELRPSSDEITVTLSGIPTASIPEVIHSKVKGSKIEVRRQFRNASNNNLISTQGYFFGRINNWSLQEEYNVEERYATNTILFECSNHLSVLSDKISGRLCNPQSNKRFFPNDTGMDRVPIIKGTKLDFGAP